MVIEHHPGELRIVQGKLIYLIIYHKIPKSLRNLKGAITKKTIDDFTNQ